jgi:hypothetical protein
MNPSSTTTTTTTARVAGRGSLLLAGACLQWAAWAGEGAEVGKGIWRCGNTYTDRPCHGKPLDVDDARTEAQRQAADEATRNARASAERMERERLRLEAAAARHGPMVIDNAPRHPPPGASNERKKLELSRPKKKKDPTFIAPRDPEKPGDKKKKTR